MSKALSANIHDPNHTVDEYDIYFNGDILSGNGDHEFSANIHDPNHTADKYDIYFNGMPIGEYPPTPSQYKYEWDFTESLTDNVEGITAVLNNCERTSDGITFTSALSNIVLGDIFGFGSTIEIDYVNAEANFGNVNGIIAWFNEGINNGFGYNYRNNKFGFYTLDTSHWANAENYGKSSFNGSGTIKIEISDSGIVHVYKDDVDIECLYNGEPAYFNSEESCEYITLGSPTSSYPCFYNMIITSVRIY